MKTQSFFRLVILFCCPAFFAHAQYRGQTKSAYIPAQNLQSEWAHRNHLNAMGERYLAQVMDIVERQKRADNAYLYQMWVQQKIAEQQTRNAWETNAAQLQTAPQMDNWLRSYASTAQLGRYNTYFGNLTNHYLRQDWAPGRKYNFAQARLAAYRFMRSPEHFPAYANLIVNGIPNTTTRAPVNGTPNLFIIIVP